MNGAAIGAVLAMVVSLAAWLAIFRRRDAKLAVTLEALLRERGPMTFEQVLVAIDRVSLLKQGGAAQALLLLQRGGKATMTPAAASLPAMQRVRQSVWRAL